jgi:hypothetical protein
MKGKKGNNIGRELKEEKSDRSRDRIVRVE